MRMLTCPLCNRRTSPRVPQWAVLLATLCLLFTNALPASAATIQRYATQITEVPQWTDESDALGNPGCTSCDCNCGNCTFAFNTSGTAWLEATSFSSFSIPAGHVITSVSVDVMARYSIGSGPGQLRVNVDVPGVGTLGPLDSPSFTSTGQCEYRFGTAGEITHRLCQPWTQALVNGIKVRVQRLGANTSQLRVKAFRVTIVTEPALPNDECAGATIVTGGVTLYSSAGATTSSLASTSCYGLCIVNDDLNLFTNDVWFQYTAQCTGVATFSTCGATNYDTILAVYSGSCGSLVELACDDDSCGPSLLSTISVPVVAQTVYRIRIGGFDGDVGGGALTVQCVAGDTCATAIPAVLGTNAFSTAGAQTDGPALPPGCASSFGSDVWFTYTSACASGGTLTFSTCTGTGFNTVLAVYTGSCGSLVSVGCNDNGCGAGTGSSVSVNSTPGTTYRIRVGGVNGASGSGTLTIACVVPPGNNQCSTASDAFNGANPFSTVNATTNGPTVPGTCVPVFANDVWFKYVATCTGTALFSTCSGTNFDTVLAVYTGSCANLVLAGCNNNGCPSGTGSGVSIVVAAGSTYFVRLGGNNGAVGTGVLTISCTAFPPNDECANAILVGEGQTTFTTVGATTSVPAVPAACGSNVGNDVWFRYQPQASGIATISTCAGAGFDTVLAVYAGSCGGSFAGCNDNGCAAGTASSITLSVSAGVAYFIRAGGTAGMTGTATLTIALVQPPSNDECTTAVVVQDGVTPFTSAGATTSLPPLPVTCALLFGNDIWYEYSASCTGVMRVSTCGSSSFDTVLAAYAFCGSTFSLACNNDGCPNPLGSSFNLVTIAGTNYRIRLGGWNGATGAGELLVECNTADLSGDGLIDGGDLGIMLASWGLPGAADLNGDGTVDGADLGILLTLWGAPT